MANSVPKVTVYVTCRNYGRFLSQCLESVFAQSLRAWELIVFDEGSGDDTAEIAATYQAKDPQRVRVIAHQEPKGLRSCANIAIGLARGEYVMRLDADDFLDESALVVLASFLDANPDIGLVYPNWIYVGEDGEFLGIERRKKVWDETEVLDLPAHGACTMIRRRVLKMIGGYEEQFSSQDGHELWMKIVHRFKVGNVGTPLFYYRQHPNSMSRHEDKLLEARRQIKRRVAQAYGGAVKPRIAAVIPAKNTYSDMPNVVLAPLAGKPLLNHTLDAALQAQLFDTIFVTTDDPEVVRHCEARGNILASLRDIGLSGTRAKLAEVVVDAVERLERQHGIFPDIIVILSVHAPLRRPAHIVEAVDTLFVYEVDQVISTYEDVDLHFRHGRRGMEPLNAGMLNTLRFEREALYVSNGAVHVLWREFLRSDTLYRGRLGHIVMPREESLQVKQPEDRWLAEFLLTHRAQSD